ncbi:hypothetical protein F5B20DRAFT_595850 [Whalleya microplaca]|nr:hypothetical protein F5B20DRAFT_595850 [Whalleya microplaca]
MTAKFSDFDEKPVVRLGRTLWSWDLCKDCDTEQPCVSQACPSRRIPQLHRYLQYCKAITANYLEEKPADTRLIKTGEDLLVIISTLKSYPDATRAELCQKCIPTAGPISDPSEQVLFMIDSSALHHSNRLEEGTFRLHWESDVPFSKFFQDLFPPGDHPTLSHANSEHFMDMKSAMKATNLKKRLGINIRPTPDIRDHLRLDRRYKVLHVYHYTAFLKEQLRATREAKDCSTISRPLSRQLVLEVLDSLQRVLFPLEDPKSKGLLQSLTSTCSFDSDILDFEFKSLRRDGEEIIPYIYLADRLSDLYNELETPQPRGWLEREMERKSGARYVMMATLVGVIFAVLLGMESLAVSSYQAHIAYQAWQYPVAPPRQ